MVMKYFAKETYIKRRAELKKRVGSGLLVFIGNEEVGMNYRDNGYAFRQDSTVLYYFASDYAGMCALIDIDNDRDIIFADELTIDDIVWMGDMPTKREMSALAGVADVRPRKEFEPYVTAALKNGQKTASAVGAAAKNTDRLAASKPAVPRPDTAKPASASSAKGAPVRRPKRWSRSRSAWTARWTCMWPP